jgi:hypothetical protein
MVLHTATIAVEIRPKKRVREKSNRRNHSKARGQLNSRGISRLKHHSFMDNCGVFRAFFIGNLVSAVVIVILLIFSSSVGLELGGRRLQRGGNGRTRVRSVDG